MAKISRREFLSQSALLGAGVVGAAAAGNLLTSCGGGETTKYTPLVSDQEPYYPELGDKAIDGRKLRVGLIGCGNRGRGAAFNLLDAADGVEIAALADMFPDNMAQTRKRFKDDRGVEVDDKMVFTGADSYKKICEDPTIDLVLIAPPGVFHAPMARYAVECGKHVFVEKPAGLDPVGCRTMLHAVRQAKAKNLALVTGTQRHHSRAYLESYRKVREGYLGEIRSAVVKWNQAAHRYLIRQPRWTDMEYMVRDHFSWGWICGDHILEQLLHNIDVFQWFSHLKPVSCVGMGSRVRRLTGNVYDNFAVDYLYEGNVRVSAQARQIDDCTRDVSETIYGTNAWWFGNNKDEFVIRDYNNNVIWQYDTELAKQTYQQRNPYVLEHVDLVNQIRSGHIVSQGETTVISSMTAAMGRESAYTGKELLYSDFSTSDLSLMPFEKPEDLKLVNFPDFKDRFALPLPGTPPNADKAK